MQVRLTQTSVRAIPGQGDGSALADVLERGQALERRAQRVEARALYEDVMESGGVRNAGEVGQLFRRISRTYWQDGDYPAADQHARPHSPCAMEIMRGGVGRAFDPELFSSFEEIVRRGSFRNTPAKGMIALGTKTG